MDIFWRSNYLNKYFLSMHMHVFQKLFTILTLFKIPFSVTGRCSIVPTSHWLQGKCAKIYLSQAASGVILQSHCRVSVYIFSVKIDALEPSKRVTGRCSIQKCRPLIGCRENVQKLTCHRQLPVWFYKVIGGFLYAIPEPSKRVTGRIVKISN